MPPDLIGPGTKALAFDGESVFTGTDLINGNTVTTRATDYIQPVSMRAGAIYTLSSSDQAIELVAIRPGEREMRTVRFRFTDAWAKEVIANRTTGQYDSRDGFVLFGDTEICVWDGARWTVLEDTPK